MPIVNYLVVGGGGGGGGTASGTPYAGGGGAGGVLTGSVNLNYNQAVTIGLGGAAGSLTANQNGTQGGNTQLLPSIIGGGGGGGGGYQLAGGAGAATNGSGGGAGGGTGSAVGGNGTGTGNKGGDRLSGNGGSGGGPGGAGVAGGDTDNSVVINLGVWGTVRVARGGAYTGGVLPPYPGSGGRARYSSIAPNPSAGSNGVIYLWYAGLPVFKSSVAGAMETRYVNGQTLHIVTANTTLQQETTTPSTYSLDAVVVGGGGGGGSKVWGTFYNNEQGGGGGGAGEVLRRTGMAVLEGASYEVIVGAASTAGARGNDSKAFTDIALGGGQGTQGNASDGSGQAGQPGGCGGGAAGRFQGTQFGGGAGSGKASSGNLEAFNNGGGLATTGGSGAGGGGAGAAGANGGASGGAGGAAVAIGFYPGNPGMMVAGGGGGGRNRTGSTGTTPSSSFGGGGAGASANNVNAFLNGSPGQQGIVVIRYLNSIVWQTEPTGGTKTVHADGYTYHVFSTPGTFTYTAGVVDKDAYATLAATLKPMVAAFTGLQQKASMATSLTAMTAAFVGDMGYRTLLGAVLPALKTNINVWHTVTVDVASTMPALTMAVELATLEAEELPGVEVHLAYAFGQMTSEAPEVITEYPHFGYFDGAMLPALLTEILAEPITRATLETMLPKMVSDGKVNFPIETYFTSSLPAMTADLDGVADNWRDAEMVASLGAMFAEFEGFQEVEVALAALLATMKGDLLVFRTVTAALGGVLGAMTASFAAEQTRAGTLDAVMPAMRSNGNVHVGYRVQLQSVLPKLTTAIVVQPDTGAILATTLPKMVAESEGAIYNSVFLDAEMAPMFAAVEGDLGNSVRLEGVLPPLTSEVVGMVDFWVYLDSLLPALTAEIAGISPKHALVDSVLPALLAEIIVEDPYLTVEAVLPALVAEINGISPKHALLDSELAALKGSLLAFISNKVTFALTLPKLRSSIEVWHDIIGDLGAVLPKLVMSATGRVINPSNLDALLAPMGFAGALHMNNPATLNAVLPKLRSNIEAWVPVRSNMPARLPSMKADFYGISPKKAELLSTMPAMTIALRVEAPYLTIETSLSPMTFDGFFNVPTGVVLGGRLPSPMRSEIYAGPPNMIDMNTRLPAMRALFGGGYPTKTYLETSLAPMTAEFFAGQPYTVEFSGLLPSMVMRIEVVGLPAEQGLAPVGFGTFGPTVGTEGGFEIASSVTFGFGDRFI